MFEWLCIKASNICKQMLQYIFGVTVTTENISNATYQFRFDLADGLSKKHEVITVSCSVIRLPNNRFWSKAFHINRKINHLSPSLGCVSISHVFFHATTWIFGLTEYLHMESHLSLSFSGFILTVFHVYHGLFHQARQRNVIHSQAFLTSAFSPLGFHCDTELSAGKEEVLGPFSPLDLGFKGHRRSLPQVRSRKRRI